MSKVKPGSDFHLDLKNIEYQLKYRQAIEQNKITGIEENTDDISEVVNSIELTGERIDSLEHIKKTNNTELAEAFLFYLETENYNTISGLAGDAQEYGENPGIKELKDLLSSTLQEAKDAYEKQLLREKMKKWHKELD